jgi:hypothetical protein
MSIEDIVRRLKEDRQIAERERLQAQIEAAFAQARTVERRRNAKPGEINPTLYGRRKDDAPQVVDAVVLRFKQMITDATDPEVELAEPEPLAQQAAPLLASIGRVPVFRKKDVKCHEINEVFQGDVMELFAEAEAALGFKKPEPKIDMLKCNIKTERPSIWKRDIFRRT